MDPLLARVQGLEKERGLYRILVALGALAGLLGVVVASVKGQAAATGPSVTTGGLVLVDANRVPRAELKVNENQPALLFYGDNNRVRQRIGLSKTGAPEMYMYEDNLRARMGVNESGHAVVELCNSGGAPRQRLSVTGMGDQRVELFAADGSPSLTIAVTGGQLTLVDGQGRKVAFEQP